MYGVSLVLSPGSERRRQGVHNDLYVGDKGGRWHYLACGEWPIYKQDASLPSFTDTTRPEQKSIPGNAPLPWRPGNRHYLTDWADTMVILTTWPTQQLSRDIRQISAWRKRWILLYNRQDKTRQDKTRQDKTRQVDSANTMPGHQHTEVSTHTCTHQSHLTVINNFWWGICFRFC